MGGAIHFLHDSFGSNNARGEQSPGVFNSARLIHIGITLLMILGIVPQAEAREYFSKQTGLACNECHLRIPRLNELGQRFKDNGYSLEKKAPAPSEAEPAQADAQASPELPAPGKIDEKSKDVTAPPPPAAKTEYLYKWQTDNGSYVFTDNPLRIPDTDKSGDEPKSAKAARKKVSDNLGNNKQAKDRAVVRKKGILSTQGIAGQRLTSETAVSEKASPQTYEECMGRLLIDAEPPSNADDMMELFRSAENACARFDSKR